MSTRTLFASLRGSIILRTDTTDFERAPAYSLPPAQALAQYAATGCFGRTFYANEREQLERVLAICAQVEPTFIARLAVYARARAQMKDMPAFLCAWLASRDQRLHERVFARVIDCARMLRTYVQILRSGVTGRKSLGTAPRRLVREWLAARDEDTLFRASAGQQPSLADILRMVHPKPAGDRRTAFYGYLLGRPFEPEALPRLVWQYERFKAGEAVETPDLPLTLLTALPLTQRDWAAIARNASWQTLRMNLNTFARHGAFQVDGIAAEAAARLADPAEIARAHAFPYQLLAAFQNAGPAVPREVRDALEAAMELAISNVPSLETRVVVCPDVSGSMAVPVTGERGSASSSVRCIDVAALVAAAVLRRNPGATVLPFESRVVKVDLPPEATVMQNAARLASIGGGGTNCSAPLRLLNVRQARADLVLIVSDNQSWVDQGCGLGTALMQEWGAFRKRNPQARLVCLDIQPYATTQAAEREDILNIGGFSDHVFDLIADFAAGRLDAGHWVDRIEAVEV